MNYSEIPGQNSVKEHLRRAVSTGKISHAYIFSGMKGSGKTDMARVFAGALLCEKDGSSDPCGQCHSCKMAASMNHPDIRLLEITGKTGIGVDDIREQINDDVMIKPFSGSRKVYIIPRAHKMTPAAQNALLKTLEEPPAYAVIILLTESHEALLPTVRSRCVRLDFETGQQYECRQETLALIRNLANLSMEAIRERAKEAASYKDTKDDHLDVLLAYFRDVMVYKSTLRTEDLVFKDESSSIRSDAGRLSFEDLAFISDRIGTARARINANIKMENVMELLLLDIKNGNVRKAGNR